MAVFFPLFVVGVWFVVYVLVEHIDYDQTMQLLVAGKTVHLGRSASDRIWVKPLRG